MIRFFILILFIGCFRLSAQQEALQYMKQVNQDQEEILSQTWDYLNSIARDASVAKSELRRYELFKSIEKSYKRVKQLPSYKENTAYRDSIVSYLNFSLDVVQGKTDELINLEKISQNSFDAMEAYLIYKNELNKLFKHKNNMVKQAQKSFAAENNITLLETKNELVEKIETANIVFEYKDQMYLNFFRCAIYEQFMLSAFNDESYNSNYKLFALNVANLADESRTVIESISNINNDNSLKKITLEGLEFFEKEAQELTTYVVAFKKAKNEFDSFKEEFELVKEKDRTKEMVDSYNQFVNQANKASNELNSKFQYFNTERAKIYNNWNKTADDFVLKHVPE